MSTINLKELILSENEILKMTFEEMDNLIGRLENTKEIIIHLKEKRKEVEKFYQKLEEYFVNTNFENVKAMIDILNKSFDENLAKLNEEVVEEVEEITEKKPKREISAEKLEILRKISKGEYPFSR